MNNNSKTRAQKAFQFLALALTMALCLTTIAACGSENSTEKPVPIVTEASPAPIKVLLGLMPQIQYIGIHTAEGRGFYQDSNLNVEFLYSEPNVDIAAAILAGQAQFGVASADRVLQARSQGEPLVAIMTLYQLDPTAVLSLKTERLHQPSDLVGKKILLWNDSVSFRIIHPGGGHRSRSSDTGLSRRRRNHGSCSAVLKRSS